MCLVYYNCDGCDFYGDFVCVLGVGGCIVVDVFFVGVVGFDGDVRLFWKFC